MYNIIVYDELCLECCRQATTVESCDIKCIGYKNTFHTALVY